MGLDFPEMCLLTERRFGIYFDVDRFSSWLLNRSVKNYQEITAGDCFDFVQELAQEKGTSLPQGSWNAFRIILYEVSGARPLSIRRESKLVADLGLE